MILGTGFALAAFANALAVKADDDASSKLKLSPILEDRERFDRRIFSGFNDNKSVVALGLETRSPAAFDDSRSDVLTRVRAGAGFTYGNIKGEVLYQFSQDLVTSQPALNVVPETRSDLLFGGNYADSNSNLLLAYAVIPNGDGNVTVGRQRISKGSQRILGTSDWDNISTSWDAVRFKDKDYDVFAGALGTADYASRDARLLGASADTKFGMSLLTFNHDATSAGRYDVYTFDQYYKHNYLGLKFALEGMAQMGTWGTKDVQAYGATAKIAKDLTKKLGFSVGGALASGGGNGGRTNQFTNPYGSEEHMYDGQSDLQGFSNLKEYSAGFSYACSAKIETTLTYYRFMLNDPTGGWIGKDGLVNYSGFNELIDPTGSKGSNVGQEVDLDTRWKLCKQATLTLGVSEFMPGDYLKAFASTNAIKNTYAFYAQLGIKFAG